MAPLTSLNRWRKWLVTCAIMAVIASIVVVYRHRTADIRFDSATWKSASTRGSLRFRMSSDLVRRLQREQWTVDQAFDRLGPLDGLAPDDPAWKQFKGRSMQYVLGSKPRKLASGPFSLYITFGQDRRVTRTEIQPH